MGCDLNLTSQARAHIKPLVHRVPDAYKGDRSTHSVSSSKSAFLQQSSTHSSSLQRRISRQIIACLIQSGWSFGTLRVVIINCVFFVLEMNWCYLLEVIFVMALCQFRHRAICLGLNLNILFKAKCHCFGIKGT